MNTTRRPTALVTGASSGIGRDLLDLFAKDGHDLVLVARSEGKLHEIAAELQQRYGIAAHVLTADLSKPDAPQQIIETLKASAIDIDVLVNNAGYGLAGEFVATDLEKELAMIQVNVVSLVHLTKLLLPAMVGRRSGRIMNVASTAAFVPGPTMSIYYATKAFVLSFSEAIADELRDSGVTVTALCPGPTATGFAEVAEMSTSRLFNMAKPMSSAEVARIGYRGLMAGKRIVITGAANKLMIQSVRLSPRRAVTALVRKFQERRP